MHVFKVGAYTLHIIIHGLVQVLSIQVYCILYTENTITSDRTKIS